MKIPNPEKRLPSPGEGSIVLTPNYARLFAMMLREAQLQADAESLFDGLPFNQQALALRAVQRFLAPLNVACQSMTTLAAVEQYREALNRIVEDIDRAAGRKEAIQADIQAEEARGEAEAESLFEQEED